MTATTLPSSGQMRYIGGGSDKVYQCQVEAADAGFIVTYNYGRYGSTLRGGVHKDTKTSVPLARALAVYEKLLKEKLGEGYKPTGEKATEFAGLVSEKQASGYLPQLLIPIEEEDVRLYIDGDSFVAQEKKDGERRMVRFGGSAGLQGINRKGDIVPLRQEIAQGLMALDVASFVLDAEEVGATLYCFDILELDGEDLRAFDFDRRDYILQGLLAVLPPVSSIKKVATFRTKASKQALFNQVKADRGEGLVFKRKSAVYEPGLAHEDQFKFKFTAEATCVVLAHNVKRSVQLGVRSQGQDKVVPIGNMTIGGKAPVPPVGSFVEVRYLYAFPDGGKLFQPAYQRLRTDKDEADLYGSLKFKQGPEEDES